MNYDSDYFDSHISGWHRASFPMISNFVTSVLGKADGLRILDLGCGDGVYGPVLRRHAAILAGIDASADGVRRARALETYDRVVLGDLADPSALVAFEPRSFDVVFSTEVIEHLEDFPVALHGARALLRDQGVLLLTTTMYYHYLFHALVVHRSAISARALWEYLAGFFSWRHRSAFVRRLWQYTGGHYHGFSRRALTRALASAGFRVDRFSWMYAEQVVPTFSLDQQRERFAKRGPHVALAAACARVVAHGVNRLVTWLGLPGPNCMVVARAVQR